MHALILAAGVGERLRPLTLQRAKPAIEFLNMPMLAFPYFWLDQLGLNELVFNTHYLPDSIRQAAKQVVSPSLPLHFSHEDKILGSGGGIWNARTHLHWDKTFAVANADGVVTFEQPGILEQMLLFHEQKDALATLLVCPLKGIGTETPGVWLDKYGEISNFGKKPDKDYLECLHYASYMFLARRIWDYLPEGPSNILYDVVKAAIAQGEKAYGYRVDDMRWFETGNAKDYLASSERCLEFLRDNSPLGKPLRQMLKRFAPNHLQHSDFSQLRLISDSSKIDGSANLKGFSVIGNAAKVAAGARLENSVVLPDAQVKADQACKNEVII